MKGAGNLNRLRLWRHTFLFAPFPAWHRLRVLPETSFFRSRVGLSVEVTGLDFIRRFTDVLFVDPTKTLFEQLQAGILTVNNYSDN